MNKEAGGYMIAFKVWLTASLILGIILLLFKAPVLALLSIVFGLPAIPLLYLFWSLIRNFVVSKPIAITFSCVIAVFISFICVLLGVYVMGYVLVYPMALFAYMLLTAPPALAAIISICYHNEIIYLFILKKQQA